MSAASRLLLRADGNARIGLGHVVRTLALAEIIRPLFAEVQLLSQQPTAAIRQLAADNGITLVDLPEQSPTLEAHSLAAFLLPTDVVVLDGYGFDAAYQQAVRARGGRLVLIDDLCHPTVADLVINHGPLGTTAAAYAARPDTRFCLGPAFSLLRTPFRAQAAHPVAAPARIASVLLCFGGADPLGLTRRSLAALLALPQLDRVGVVLGSSFGGLEALQALAAEWPGRDVEFYYNLDASALVAAFRQHELAVVPASTVLLEALVLGRPAITGYYAANQQPLADYVQQHGQAFSVGNFADLAADTLAQALHQGLHFHQTTLRQPYVDRLRPEVLQAEFRRLLS